MESSMFQGKISENGEKNPGMIHEHSMKMIWTSTTDAYDEDTPLSQNEDIGHLNGGKWW